MSSTETQTVNTPLITAKEKRQLERFYGYNSYQDAAGCFLGEEKPGSMSFYVFPSKEVFEEAVKEYNIVGRIPVKSAAIGKA